jgi:hypothetical protein
VVARRLRRAGAVREGGAGLGRRARRPPSSVSLHQAATVSSPPTPTPSSSGSFLAVGEHRISPHLLWRPTFGSRSRVEPCALVTVSQNAAAHALCDAGHRARIGKSFLAGAAAFIDARAACCSTLCFPVCRHERRHAGHVRTLACVAAEQSNSAWSHARPGSTHAHSPFTSHACAWSRAARPSFWSPKTGARRWAFSLVRPSMRTHALETHLASAGYPQPHCRTAFCPQG